MRRHLTFLLTFLSIMPMAAQPEISGERCSPADFPIVSSGRPAAVYVAETENVSVARTASLFADDIERVTGIRPELVSGLPEKGKDIIVIGTLDGNAFIDALVKSGKIDVSTISGGWEQYVIQTVDRPCPGIRRVLVVAGCDRRGAAYGTFSLSEAMGVSPMYWWADIPVERKKEVYLRPLEYASSRPSVKYRGIFINDEGWGMTPWASETYDPDLGDIGPKTYSRICEFIIRMKGNMLAPAMHPGSGAFNRYPENKAVADSFAVVMTSSHCEPLLFNNVTEWSRETMGDWNYITNKDGINVVLDRRISENGKYENVYTLAMRGIHDAGLVGVPKEREVSLMEEVLEDQRKILSRHIRTGIDSIPQIFVPYKEVLDIYERGMKVPDDVTLVWPDDNFGYIKRLSNEDERKRSGGSGVYYHISYCGEPHDYLWLNTTSPSLMYEELKKAYDTGADRYWLLNVGDIKPGELGIKQFMDMAWDISSFDFVRAWSCQTDFLSAVFGEEYRARLTDIMDTYYRLGFQHRPEGMGWGYEWNDYHDRERVTDTDFSFVNYSEAENRMKEYDRIASACDDMMADLEEEYRPAFYELVGYPVKGAALMNRKMLTAQKNRWYAWQGRAATDSLADLTALYQDSLDRCTKAYNSLLGGKWNRMMSVPPGWTATYQEMPPVVRLGDVAEDDKYHGCAEPAIFIPGQYAMKGVSGPHVLPSSNPYVRKDLFIELYNKGTEPFCWEASAEAGWIRLSEENSTVASERLSGTVSLQTRINVEIDWSAMPAGEDISGTVAIEACGRRFDVHVPVFNPQSPSKDDLKGIYVEDNGCVSIEGGHFHRSVENDDVKIHKVHGLGYEPTSVQLGEALSPVQNMWRTDTAPRAEYDFYTFNAGNADIKVYALPLFPVDSRHDTRFGVMIDDGMVQWMTVSAKEYSGQWRRNVAANSAVGTVSLNIDRPGMHTIKVICADPGAVIQKIVIDLGGEKRSYLGPPVTYVE